MQLIDTHTHIYLPEFDADRSEAIERAIGCGVTRLLMPNIDVESVNSMLSVADQFPGTCMPMIGLHPTSVKMNYQEELDQLANLYDKTGSIAVGEIGIDLYWDKTFIEEQLIAFRKQIIIGLERNLPVVVHSREAFREVFSVLEEFRGSKLWGVLHAFTGGVAEVEKALELGFTLGIGGIVTFKNSGLDQIVRQAGLKNIILETDSPYLAPVPYRGKRNESSYICIINKKIADITGMTEEKVAEVTTSNSCELFNLLE